MDKNGGPADLNLRISGLLFLAINFPQGVKSNTSHRHDYLKKIIIMVQTFSIREKRDRGERSGRGRKGGG